MFGVFVRSIQKWGSPEQCRAFFDLNFFRENFPLPVTLVREEMRGDQPAAYLFVPLPPTKAKLSVLLPRIRAAFPNAFDLIQLGLDVYQLLFYTPQPFPFEAAADLAVRLAVQMERCQAGAREFYLLDSDVVKEFYAVYQKRLQEALAGTGRLWVHHTQALLDRVRLELAPETSALLEEVRARLAAAPAVLRSGPDLAEDFRTLEAALREKERALQLRAVAALMARLRDPRSLKRTWKWGSGGKGDAVVGETPDADLLARLFAEARAFVVSEELHAALSMLEGLVTGTSFPPIDRFYGHLRVRMSPSHTRGLSSHDRSRTAVLSDEAARGMSAQQFSLLLAEEYVRPLLRDVNQPAYKWMARLHHLLLAHYGLLIGLQEIFAPDTAQAWRETARLRAEEAVAFLCQIFMAAPEVCFSSLSLSVPPVVFFLMRPQVKLDGSTTVQIFARPQIVTMEHAYACIDFLKVRPPGSGRPTRGASSTDPRRRVWRGRTRAT